MKIKPTLVLAALALAAGTHAVGADFSVNGLNYSVWTANTVAIMPAEGDNASYSDLTQANFTDSVTWNGTTYAVAGIYEKAFANASFSERVTLPAPITTIGQWAFHAATGSSVTLGAKATEYSANAFANNKFSLGIYVNVDNPALANLTGSDGTNCDGVLVTKDRKTILNFPGGKTQSSWNGTTALSSFSIPSFITEIGDFCFYRNVGLATITIPSSVTRIGRAAFFECLDYDNITIPSSVTELGQAAFQGCVNCLRININTTRLEEIPYHAFFCMVSLPSITIPEGVKTIGEGAMGSCEKLQTVNLSSTVEDLGESCLQGAPITAINLRNVKHIGFMAFGRCESLRTITGGANLETIDNAAFARCDALTTLSFPEGVKTLVSNTFFRCASLTSLQLPASLECIPLNPVTGCDALSSLTVAADAQHFVAIDNAIYATTGSTVLGEPARADGDHSQPTVLVTMAGNAPKKSIDVPEGVTTLGAQCLREVELNRVTLPSTLTTIRQWAFGDVYNIRKVTCKALTPPAGGDPENEDYIFEEDVFNNATLLVPQAALEAYRAHQIWGRFKTISDIESQVVPVDTTTRFPYTVENDYTFYFRVIGDDEVEYIAPSDYDPDLSPYSGVFDWDAPETVEYNDVTYRVTTVGEGAFRDATVHGGNTLSNLIWLNGVETVKADAFTGWNINWLGLNAVKEIDPTALRGNKINRFSIFGDGFTHSADTDHGSYNGNNMAGDIVRTADGKRVLWAWGGDRRANSWLNANRSLTTSWTFNYDEIGDYALCDNTSLTDVAIEGATRIGAHALEGMTELTTLTLPATLTEVGADAFAGSAAIESVTCLATTPPAGAVFDEEVYARIRENGGINVPAEALTAYQADRNWRRFWTAEQPALPGDVNGDGTVDVQDVNDVINAILADIDLDGADINGDGTIDVDDVNEIINAILAQ